MEGEDCTVVVGKKEEGLLYILYIAVRWWSVLLCALYLLVFLQKVFVAVFFPQLVYGLADTYACEPLARFQDCLFAAEIVVFEDCVLHYLFCVKAVAYNPQAGKVEPLRVLPIYKFYVGMPVHLLCFSLIRRTLFGFVAVCGKIFLNLLMLVLLLCRAELYKFTKNT